MDKVEWQKEASARLTTTALHRCNHQQQWSRYGTLNIIYTRSTMAFVKTRWIRHNFLDCVHDTKNSDFFRYTHLSVLYNPVAFKRYRFLMFNIKKFVRKFAVSWRKVFITSIYQLFPTLHVADGFTNFPSNIITIIDLQRSFLLFCFFDMKKENNTHRASLRLT